MYEHEHGHRIDGYAIIPLTPSVLSLAVSVSVSLSEGVLATAKMVISDPHSGGPSSTCLDARVLSSPDVVEQHRVPLWYSPGEQ